MCVFVRDATLCDNYVSHGTLGLASQRTRTQAFGGPSGILATPPSCAEAEWWSLRFPNPADTVWGSKGFGFFNNYTLRLPAVCSAETRWWRIWFMVVPQPFGRFLSFLRQSRAEN